MKQLKCDILDIGNQIIALSEYLSKKQKTRKSDVWTLLRHARWDRRHGTREAICSDGHYF